MRKRDERPARPPGMISFSNLFLALIGALFLICASVVLVLHLRTIYYFDIGYLKLEEETGMSRGEIRENYDALIDYNLAYKGIDKLELPSFPMSKSGEIHFAEVKRIFTAVQCLFLITGVFTVLGLIRKVPRRDFGSLKLMSIFSILIPAVLGILAVLNWEQFFVAFHHLFFNNDYWIFNPMTDPVIRILPDTFFAHCAAAVLFFLVLGSLFTGALYRILVPRRVQAEAPKRRKRHHS